MAEAAPGDLGQLRNVRREMMLAVGIGKIFFLVGPGLFDPSSPNLDLGTFSVVQQCSKNKIVVFVYFFSVLLTHEVFFKTHRHIRGC